MFINAFHVQAITEAQVLCQANDNLCFVFGHNFIPVPSGYRVPTVPAARNIFYYMLFLYIDKKYNNVRKKKRSIQI